MIAALPSKAGLMLTIFNIEFFTSLELNLPQ